MRQLQNHAQAEERRFRIRPPTDGGAIRGTQTDFAGSPSVRTWRWGPQAKSSDLNPPREPELAATSLCRTRNGRP